MKVLVTGGSGFIGSHLLEELNKKGHEVDVFDIKESNDVKCKNFITGDIKSKDTVDKAMRGRDIVFHLAGLLGTHELVANAIAATEVNVLGTLNILESARKHGVKVVFASKPNCWLNTYTITKVASEKFCLMYHKEFGVDVVILKWFNVYGSRQSLTEYQKAVPTLIVQALKGEPLLVYGSGEQTADFIYIDDAIEAAVRAAEMPGCSGKVIEIGSGAETTINHLAGLIIQLTGSKSVIKHVPMRVGETKYTRIKSNIENMKKLLDFTPKTALEQGMAKTIEYYKELLKKEKELKSFSRWA